MWVLLFLCLFSLCYAGCSLVSESGEAPVQFWALGREGEVVQAMLPEFERRNPGIKVQVQQIPWTAAHEKLLTAYVGKATPDLAQVGNTWIPEFVALDALEDLHGWKGRSPTIAEDEYFPGIWKTNLIDGALFGIPWYVDTRVLFYRTDLLPEAGIQAPPRDWNQWMEAMRRLKSRAGESHYAILLPMDEWAQPVIFAMQKGSTILKDNGRYGAFRDRPFREAFEFYVSLFHAGLAPVASNIQIANVYQQFAQGDFSLYITGPWNLGEFRSRLSPEMQSHWNTAPLPSAVPGSGVSLAGGSSLVMFRKSPRKEQVWKLIEYLSEPEQQIRLYSLTGDLPARTAAWEDSALAGDPKADAFREQLGRVQPPPQVPEWEQIATKIAEYSEEAIRRRMTNDEALAALDQSVNHVLEKRRWILDRGKHEPGRGKK